MQVLQRWTPLLGILAVLSIAPPTAAQNAVISNPEQAAPSQGLGSDQSQQLDANQTLFTVLAAINAAGYDADLDSPTNHGMRGAVRDYIEQLDAEQGLESLPPLRKFFSEHRRGGDLADLNQYVSFALLSAGAPDFEPAHPELPQPPDAAALQAFPPLLAAFYSEAKLASAFAQALPYYEQVLEQYSQPVSSEVLKVSAYLRNPLRGSPNRRFQVFIDLLAAPNQVITRNYLDEYYVVITPSPELRIEEVRHAYLHYLLDPLGIRHANKLARFATLGDFALDSPILAEQYRDDFNLLATECFIKAIEARVTRQPERVDQAMREGFVLTAAFADLLPAYEEQEVGMDLFFPDMVDQIDILAEASRMQQIEFVSEAQVRTIQVTKVVGPPPATGIAKILEDAEDAYLARELETAKAIYNQVFTETNEKSMHAKAYYGLARIAVLERDPEAGDGLFRRVLEFEPDDSTKSWSLLYLGKLADSQGLSEPALQFYRDALAVPAAPDQVRREAQSGLDGAFARPVRQQ